MKYKEYKKTGWKDILEQVSDKWGYISAIRGPDVRSGEMAEHMAINSTKELFTCFLRGSGDHTPALGIAHFEHTIASDMYFDKALKGLEYVGHHYKVHIKEGLLALFPLGGEVTEIARFLFGVAAGENPTPENIEKIRKIVEGY